MAAPPHRPSSCSLNPFDSDEDSSPAHPASSSSSSSAPAHSNPFDDDAAHPPRSRTRGSRAEQELPHSRRSFAPHQQPAFDSPNLLDDHEPTAAPLKPKNRSSDQGSWLDEGPKPQATITGQGEGLRIRRSSRSQTREPGAESGNAALRNSRNSDDSGAKQASKPVRENLNQTQKAKEGSYNAFKSNDGPFELKTTKPKSQAHDQLLPGDVESQYKGSYGSATRIRYDDNQFQEADLEHKSVQELEGYALQKSEETTKSIQNSLKVAESTRGDAERTLITLHGQGEQIGRTHEKTLDLDQSLYAGEKLLGSLGGMFSKTWKPKKGRPVKGPALVINDSHNRRANHLQQRAALGIERSNRKGLNNRSSLDSEAQSHQQTTQAKLETERAKQDDGLSDLSNVLDQLKEMSVDMGSEISRQTVALDHLQDDIISLDERVKGANIRGRRLLGK